MAAGISVATTPGAVLRAKHSPLLGPKPAALALRASPSLHRIEAILRMGRRSPNLTVCFVLGDEKLRGIQESGEEREIEEEESGGVERAISLAEKMARKKSERFSYLVAAVMSSFGVTSMAIMAVYYRFAWQMEGGEVPYTEMFGTFALSVGAAVGMEFWARWAHKALWHASLWHMHESHHKPNDVFAIIKRRSGHSPPLLRFLPQRPNSRPLLRRRPRNHGFRHSVHVRPRRPRSPEIPGGAHRRCSLFS